MPSCRRSTDTARPVIYRPVRSLQRPNLGHPEQPEQRDMDLLGLRKRQIKVREYSSFLKFKTAELGGFASRLFSSLLRGNSNSTMSAVLRSACSARRR